MSKKKSLLKYALSPRADIVNYVSNSDCLVNLYGDDVMYRADKHNNYIILINGKLINADMAVIKDPETNEPVRCNIVDFYDGKGNCITDTATYSWVVDLILRMRNKMYLRNNKRPFNGVKIAAAYEIVVRNPLYKSYSLYGVENHDEFVYANKNTRFARMMTADHQWYDFVGAERKIVYDMLRSAYETRHGNKK